MFARLMLRRQRVPVRSLPPAARPKPLATNRLLSTATTAAGAASGSGGSSLDVAAVAHASEQLRPNQPFYRADENRNKCLEDVSASHGTFEAPILKRAVWCGVVVWCVQFIREIKELVSGHTDYNLSSVLEVRAVCLYRSVCVRCRPIR